jgi:GcrA cell cycle regulator
MSNDTWTEEMIASLHGLWSEGHPAAEIGRRLGVSKSAVIGKVHRLDMPARPSPIKAGGSAAGPRLREVVPKLSDMIVLPSCAPTPREPAPPVPDPPRVERRQAAISRTKTCCWPIGNPKQSGFRFCDAPALMAKPYCGDHANQAYRTTNRQDDRRDESAAA